MLEAAEPALGKKARKLRKRVKEVQSLLGDDPEHAPLLHAALEESLNEARLITIPGPKSTEYRRWGRLLA